MPSLRSVNYQQTQTSSVFHATPAVLASSHLSYRHAHTLSFACVGLLLKQALFKMPDCGAGAGREGL